MEKFADILKDLMLDRHIKSIRELGRLTKIPATYFSQYFKGRIPTIDIAIKLSNFFNVSLDYLFGLSTDKSCRGYQGKNLSVLLDRYKQALKNNNTTNWLFCKKYNLSEANWRHWRAGQEPKLETLIVIADKLSISIDYLIGRI